MKTVFKMNDKHQMTDVPNEGTEGVFDGSWVPRIKLDGTACAVIYGKLYKRYDRKLKKNGQRRLPPPGWMACSPKPDPVTNHWPGWVPVLPTDKHHVAGWDNHMFSVNRTDGTYELLGSKVQNNPYNMTDFHALIRHDECRVVKLTIPMTYDSLKTDLKKLYEEGIVFHGPDGQFFKLRRSDFGLGWPIV
jgi:hypothetical protein